jgi:3-deoxy-D-arabino-heptulosonate 7-phosphate (DAHP) synthase
MHIWHFIHKPNLQNKQLNTRHTHIVKTHSNSNKTFTNHISLIQTFIKNWDWDHTIFIGFLHKISQIKP